MKIVVFALLAGAVQDQPILERLEEYRGRIVVLNFWATWCEPCRREMPLLAAVQKAYAAQGVEVIGASADAAETQPKIPGFVRRRKIEFPIWLGATTADMQRLELGEELPATAILDRDGRVAARLLGPLQKGDLETRLDWLLGDRQTPPPPALVRREEHAGEDHEHAAVGLEGASLVPS